MKNWEPILGCITCGTRHEKRIILQSPSPDELGLAGRREFHLWRQWLQFVDLRCRLFGGRSGLSTVWYFWAPFDCVGAFLGCTGDRTPIPLFECVSSRPYVLDDPRSHGGWPTIHVRRDGSVDWERIVDLANRAAGVFILVLPGSYGLRSQGFPLGVRGARGHCFL